MDHYLDVEFDLSKVFFITTANVVHTIPQPLQDRMEILRLEGYTEPEKLEIAKRFLVKKQREAAGLNRGKPHPTDDGIVHIIRHYTREAGVRNLEREIANVSRKVARKVVKDGRNSRSRWDRMTSKSTWESKVPRHPGRREERGGFGDGDWPGRKWAARF
jgi:ATP-dependent Lon protease